MCEASNSAVLRLCSSQPLFSFSPWHNYLPERSFTPARSRLWSFVFRSLLFWTALLSLLVFLIRKKKDFSQTWKPTSQVLFSSVHVWPGLTSAVQVKSHGLSTTELWRDLNKALKQQENSRWIWPQQWSCLTNSQPLNLHTTLLNYIIWFLNKYVPLHFWNIAVTCGKLKTMLCGFLLPPCVFKGKHKQMYQSWMWNTDQLLFIHDTIRINISVLA